MHFNTTTGHQIFILTHNNQNDYSGGPYVQLRPFKHTVRHVEWCFEQVLEQISRVSILQCGSQILFAVLEVSMKINMCVVTWGRAEIEEMRDHNCEANN